MTTQTTNNVTITVSIPDSPSANVVFKNRFMFLSGLEIIEKNESYTLTLDASGDGTIAIPTPDATGDNAQPWVVTLPENEAYIISVSYDAGGLDLATLLAAAATTQTADAIVTLLAGYATDAELAAAIANYLPLTGGTLSGALAFSGTNHAGITPISLTTAQRDALGTPSGNPMIWNSDDEEFQGWDGDSWEAVGGSSGGDVVGPASSTDNAVARFDSTTGKLLQNSGVTIADDGQMHIGKSGGLGLTIGNSGVGWTTWSATVCSIMVNNTRILDILSGSYAGIYAYNGGRQGGIKSTVASSTVPVICPDLENDNNTGIGRAGADQLSLIAGGVEAAQVDTNATANQTKMQIKDATGTLRRVAIYNDGTRDLLYLV